MDVQKIIDSMWRKTDDEKTYECWDDLGRRLDAKLYPIRWYLLAAGALLGILGGIYF